MRRFVLILGLRATFCGCASDHPDSGGLIKNKPAEIRGLNPPSTRITNAGWGSRYWQGHYGASGGRRGSSTFTGNWP